jgi:hypothetical protein
MPSALAGSAQSGRYHWQWKIKQILDPNGVSESAGYPMLQEHRRKSSLKHGCLMNREPDPMCSAGSRSHNLKFPIACKEVRCCLPAHLGGRLPFHVGRFLFGIFEGNDANAGKISPQDFSSKIKTQLSSFTAVFCDVIKLGVGKRPLFV